MDLSVKMVREEEQEKVQVKARDLAEERVLDLLLPEPQAPDNGGGGESGESQVERPSPATREKLRRMLRAGKLDDRSVDIELTQNMTPMIEVLTPQGMEEMESNIKEMFSNLLPKQTKRKTVKIPEAIKLLTQEEAARLVDMETVVGEATRRVEQSGIVFIDEIDKIAGRETVHGPDVSREGVQRDLLPIVEGSTVSSKYGLVRTDHILFIASGAFHNSKPSDLIPEFQGRFPHPRGVELPRQERLRAYPDRAQERAHPAVRGAPGDREDPPALRGGRHRGDRPHQRRGQREDGEHRRAPAAHHPGETLLDEISFTAPEMPGREVRIDAAYVGERLDAILKDQDLSRYIL